MQTWAQNLPEWLRYNSTVDLSLPPGTVELRDEAGKVLGRIENIGQDQAPIEPRFAVALRLKALEKLERHWRTVLEAVEERLGQDGCDCGDESDLPCELCQVQVALKNKIEDYR